LIVRIFLGILLLSADSTGRRNAIFQDEMKMV